MKLNGARRRIRTTDTRIFNPLLYRLSYQAEGAQYSREAGSRRAAAGPQPRLLRVRSTPSCLSLR